MKLPPKSVVPIARMTVGESEENAVLLDQMSKAAETYVRSLPWCGEVLSAFFGGGVGGTFAVFLYQVAPTGPHGGSWIWVVVGWDLPTTYFPVEECGSPTDVFSKYLEGMEKWVELARKGQQGTSDAGIPTVSVPALPEWADKVDRSLQELAWVKPFLDIQNLP